MEMGVFAIHFAQATSNAGKIIVALDSLQSSVSLLSSDISQTYDQILFFLKQMHAPLFSLINDLNHILSWTTTSYPLVSAPLREHIPRLVKDLLAFWDIWRRYVDTKQGFTLFHDDATCGRLPLFFSSLAPLQKSLQELLVERELERDFRAQLSNSRMAA